VQDAALMGVMHRPRHRGDELDRRTLLGEVLDAPRQRTAVDQFHAEEGLAVLFADLVNGHDVGVIEVGCLFRLGAKPLPVRRRSEVASQDHLQGHDAVEADLPSLVDNAHAAAGDLFEQLVIAEGSSRFGCDRGTSRRFLILARAFRDQSHGKFSCRLSVHASNLRHRKPGQKPNTLSGNGYAGLVTPTQQVWFHLVREEDGYGAEFTRMTANYGHVLALDWQVDEGEIPGLLHQLNLCQSVVCTTRDGRRIRLRIEPRTRTVRVQVQQGEDE
jgi:hypothetical protein